MLYYAGFVFWYQDYQATAALAWCCFPACRIAWRWWPLACLLPAFFVRDALYQLILITTLPFFFLSNLSWPEVLRLGPCVAKLIPQPWHHLMIKATQYGASWHEAMQEILNLLVLILGYGSF